MTLLPQVSSKFIKPIEHHFKILLSGPECGLCMNYGQNLLKVSQFWPKDSPSNPEPTRQLVWLHRQLNSLLDPSQVAVQELLMMLPFDSEGIQPNQWHRGASGSKDYHVDMTGRARVHHVRQCTR